MRRRILLGSEMVEYELTRKNVKNINFTVRPDMIVRVSANKHVPLNYIEEAMRFRSEFILKAIERYKRADNEKGVFYLGRLCETVHGSESCFDGEKIILENVDDKQKCIDSIYVMGAAEVFPRIYDSMYSRFSGFERPALKLRAMKSLWGSCNRIKGVITMNTRLMAAPVQCIEAVAAHELAHVIVGNHSPDFYKELAKVMPDYKERNDLLKRYRQYW